MAQTVKRLPPMRETWVWSLGRKDPLEKEMETHSSALAWTIPWMDEPGRPQSMGSQRVGYDWATSLVHWIRCSPNNSPMGHGCRNSRYTGQQAQGLERPGLTQDFTWQAAKGASSPSPLVQRPRAISCVSLERGRGCMVSMWSWELS